MAWACRAAAIADALVAWLNDPARDWYRKFKAVRVWEPVHDFVDLDEDLNCDVVPFMESADELMSRATKQQDYSTMICWRQRFIPETGAEDGLIINNWVDTLVGFVESVNDKLIDVEINTTGFRVFSLRREIDLSFIGDALKEKRSFLAFSELTWRELRAR